MPYDNGVRISQDEYVRRKRIREGRDPEGEQLRTGPNGVNPGEAPVLDEETGAPVEKKKAGTRRSGKTQAKAAKAIAVATGTELPDIASLDAGSEDE